MSNKKLSQRLFVFGEILWDCFSDNKILGGAPLNVAWNCQALGLQPTMISRVGDDDLGRDAINRLHQHGMSTDFVAIDSQRETGKVHVRFLDDEPDYDILANVAYDYIEHPKQLLDDLDTPPLFYHGSLALRTEASRKRLMDFCIGQRAEQRELNRFVDINIRHPHFEINWLDDLVENVGHVKLNVSELSEITEIKVPDELRLDEHSVTEAVTKLFERYAIEQIWLTMGSIGAAWFHRDGRCESVAAPHVDSFRDAVGAGDAFASVVLAGTIKGLPPSEILPIAVSFAARVCTIQGATTNDKEFYRQFRF